jgi:hypothetical protein
MSISIEQPSQLRTVQKENRIRKIKKHSTYQSNSSLLLRLNLRMTIFSLKRKIKARQIAFMPITSLMNLLVIFRQRESREM